MEGSKLRIIDLKMAGFLREVENAVQYGFPVLLQDILEEIDPALEPVLSKSILKIGNRVVMRIGDKELDYSPDFKLYITTKLANPHYTPEISTKATVVNFAVKKDGLEAQLLGIVVQKEVIAKSNHTNADANAAIILFHNLFSVSISLTSHRTILLCFVSFDRNRPWKSRRAS